MTIAEIKKRSLHTTVTMPRGRDDLVNVHWIDEYRDFRCNKALIPEFLRPFLKRVFWELSSAVLDDDSIRYQLTSLVLDAIELSEVELRENI